MINPIHLKHSLLLILFSIVFSAQTQTLVKSLQWTEVQTHIVADGAIKTLAFVDADNADEWGLLPAFTRQFQEPAQGLSYQFKISNPQFSKLEIDDVATIADFDLIGDEIKTLTQKTITRGRKNIVFKLLPLRQNDSTGYIEKLESFILSYQLIPSGENILRDGTIDYADNSVLSAGDWFKIGVPQSGIYKVLWQDLNDLGMNMSELQSDNLRLFGNGGGMLPQKNSEFRYDDLLENAIWVEDGGDGSFDDGDYFLFYGQSPNTWTFKESAQIFEHSTNKFTHSNFYFITIGAQPGKRIQTINASSISAEKIINTYTDYVVHEVDENSLISSGTEWYGEIFNEVLVQDFNFSFPDRVVTDEVFLAADFAARSTSTSSFSVFVNNDSVFSDNITAIVEGLSYKYANQSGKTRWFMANETPDITITLKYNRKDDKSIGWLNYIALNVTSNLVFHGTQFSFRNLEAANTNELNEFRLAGANANLRVWDITAPLTPANRELTIDETTGKFTLVMDSLHEFIAYDGSDFLSPELVGYVLNQNLHAHHTAEFIIVSHPDFIPQAQRLAALHEELDDMHVIVVNLFDIYNEFSSGAPDITAIRDFVRMIYQRSGTPPALKYLLLFGDGSFDPLDRLDGNLSFIPTFQSNQSLWLTATYVTDDYFGLMDPEEGKDAAGNVDIGIGRFAINTPENAKLMVDKVENYMRMSSSVQGNWRNSITFIADDEDNNLHVYQADTVLVPRIIRKNPSLNIDKIYFDSYLQETNANGQSYPQATIDINKKIDEGTLIVNYTGHGGETGLSAEKVVQIPDILSWDNYNMLPVFVTATCEFSRFDYPTLVSAGELVLLNQNGGGIALFTTTRLAFASSNLLLNKRIYDTLFNAYPEIHPRLGDLMMYSKTPSTSNLRNFVLLGDPALKLALPGYKVVTDSLNGIDVDIFTDTLNANSKIIVSGHIENYVNPGEVLHSFNGTVFTLLYDKPGIVTTLGNDPKSYPYDFETQNNILCKGKASVKDGRFKISFVLPLDISYQFGNGKISYYAFDSLMDAAGNYSALTIGGVNGASSVDNSGPDIQLFLNEMNMTLPDLVNTQSILFAKLSDPSGINSTGTGIGHDIVLTMNGDSYDSHVLNDLFEPVLDDFTTGTIVFPLNTLPLGEYTLEMKAWDMFNNSSTKEISFTVTDEISVDLLEVYNYPNPFSDQTRFTFRHNQFEGDLKVVIDIYNFYGQHVKTIGPESVVTNGYEIEPILWDGDSDGGSKLGAGFYFYTIKVSNEKNLYAERKQKLIISE